MEDLVKNHVILGTLEQLAALKGEPAIVEASSDAQAFWATQKVFQFASIVDQRLRQTPATILAIPVLNQLNSALTSALNEVRNYVSNKNVGHLTNAVNQLETVGLPSLAQIPVVSSGEDIGRIADEFISQTQGALKAVIGERDRLQQEVDNLIGRIGKLTDQVQSLTEAVATQQAQALNVVNTVQTAYAAKEQEFQKTFDRALAAQTKAHDVLMTSIADEQKADKEEAKKQQEVGLAELHAQLAHAKKIVGIIGNIGVTGNYQEVARTEGSAANTWRWITLAAFVVAIVIGSLALWFAHKVDLGLTVARMLFAFLILGVTVYTGRESARHRSNADRAKRVELELASLGPFVESLDKVKQDALREKLTSDYFGKESEPHTVSPTVETKDLVELLKAAISRLGK